MLRKLCLQGMRGWSVRGDVLQNTNTENQNIAFKMVIWKSKLFRWTPKNAKAQSHILSPNISKLKSYCSWYIHVNCWKKFTCRNGRMKWMGKDTLSNTNTHACNSLVFAEIRVGNTKGGLSCSTAKKHTCKECKDEVNQKGYLTKLQH